MPLVNVSTWDINSSPNSLLAGSWKICGCCLVMLFASLLTVFMFILCRLNRERELQPRWCLRYGMLLRCSSQYRFISIYGLLFQFKNAVFYLLVCVAVTLVSHLFFCMGPSKCMTPQSIINKLKTSLTWNWWLVVMRLLVIIIIFCSEIIFILKDRQLFLTE